MDQVIEDYRSAVGAKDVEAFVALYDDDVEVFDTWGSWSHDGSEAWRAVVVEWFGSLGDNTIRVEFQDVEEIRGDQIGSVHAFVTYRGISSEGKELRSMTNRLTWVLKRNASIWKIAHEHTSAPVDPESGKGMLQR
jgi:uncharacterized protein (TIGR02246 family)